jgi:hypothetical protein
LKFQPSELTRYAHMGMAAYIPGMQRMIELMQHQLDELRHELQLAQDGDGSGRKALKSPRKSAGAKWGWEGMSAEERSREMKRRMAVAKRKKQGKLHPRDKDHPDHEKWGANRSEARKKIWAGKTKAEKEQWKEAMKKGKRQIKRAKEVA